MASIINSDDGVISGTAGLKSTGANDGALNIQTNGTNAITVSSAQTVAINGNNISADNSLGFRNRIINGAMVIAQRGTSTFTQNTSNQFGLDRFDCTGTVTSKVSFTQSSVAPSGFINSTLITSLSAYSVLTGDFFVYRQRIEGFNCADLGWGAAGAATVTVSFWVRSSLTGSFGGYLSNGSLNRSYPYSYTINAANTWEQKTITIAGDTSGTWLTTNGSGIEVGFSLGAGVTYSGTANTWSGSYYVQPTGSTSIVGTNGATFYITGVQLEVGSVATPFERRDYGRELAMCQRYYYLHAKDTTKAIGSGGYTASNILYATVQFPVSMRTAPTSASTTGTNYYIASFGSSNDSFNSLTLQFTTEQSTFLYNTAEASGTANSYAIVYTNNASALLAFQAEL